MRETATLLEQDFKDIDYHKTQIHRCWNY